MKHSLKPLDIARLGELQADGSIRLYDAGRDYRRIRQTSQDVLYLHSQGFVEVMSSNVSAAKRDGEDLIIRFHSGGVYRYHNKGNLFDDLMKSSSKGKFVHRRLRATGASFSKTGDMPLPSGKQPTETYEEAAERLERETTSHNVPVVDMLQFLILGAGATLATEDMTKILMSLKTLKTK